MLLYPCGLLQRCGEAPLRLGQPGRATEAGRPSLGVGTKDWFVCWLRAERGRAHLPPTQTVVLLEESSSSLCIQRIWGTPGSWPAHL